MRRSLRPAFATLVTLILVLAACQGSASESASGSPGSGATGGTVRVGYPGAPDSLNPGLALFSESYTLFELVYDTPISYLPDGTYVPELATDWSVADDGVTWTMHIVDNAKFHDGTPLTAEDVKFSLEMYRDNTDFPYESSYPDVFTDIEAPDATTVILHADQPIANFEYRMAFMYIVPKHIWENEDPTTFDNAEMIGSGSFKLVDYQIGEFAQLEAVKDHWNISPAVDGVIFQTISNPDARVAALTAGDVDMITEFPLTALSTLQSTENVKVVQMESIGGDLRDVFFNVADPADCPGPSDLVPDGGVCSGHPALRDVNVRQALAKAIDKQQLIDVSTLGTASWGVSLVPPGLGDYFVGTDADWEFNVDAANQQLDDAGYADTNGDGIRECLPSQDCDDLTFRFYYPDDIDPGPARGRPDSQHVAGGGRRLDDSILRQRHADQHLLPGVRLRRHAVALGVRPRSAVPARRADLRRHRDRVQRDRILRRRVRRPVQPAGGRSRPSDPGRHHPSDAAKAARGHARTSFRTTRPRFRPIGPIGSPVGMKARLGSAWRTRPR